MDFAHPETAVAVKKERRQNNVAAPFEVVGTLSGQKSVVKFIKHKVLEQSKTILLTMVESAPVF